MEVKDKMTAYCCLKMPMAVANFLEFQKGEGTLCSDDLYTERDF